MGGLYMESCSHKGSQKTFTNKFMRPTEVLERIFFIEYPTKYQKDNHFFIFALYTLPHLFDLNLEIARLQLHNDFTNKNSFDSW